VLDAAPYQRCFVNWVAALTGAPHGRRLDGSVSYNAQLYPDLPDLMTGLRFNVIKTDRRCRIFYAKVYGALERPSS
jgi:hypothetical protein